MRWGIFHWCLDQAQAEVLDLPDPCGVKGVPQRKAPVPRHTALPPRTECRRASALVARDAKEQRDTPFHSGVPWGCWHCGDPG